MAVAADDIWPVIRDSLREDPAAACMKCLDVTLSRLQVLTEVQRIARHLDGRRVGVYLPRSVASVLVTLAIWRNGGAYVPIAAAGDGTRVEVEVRGKRLAATVVPMPFFPKSYVRDGVRP